LVARLKGHTNMTGFKYSMSIIIGLTLLISCSEPQLTEIQGGERLRIIGYDSLNNVVYPEIVIIF